MHKNIGMSYNIAKHNDIFQLLKEIDRRGMNLSGIMRELLREFRDRGYCFDTEEKEADIFNK